tara:strand:- start:296 stop:547 length:252 start_codon:yes stop_codon:yes gene_type:complete
MAAAKIAGYIAPYLVKEAMDMAKPKVKGFFTKEEHTHTDGSKSTQEIKGDIKNGKAKNIEVNTKSDGSMTPVKETKVTYKLKK